MLYLLQALNRSIIYLNSNNMKKWTFKILAKLNKVVLPSLYKKDPMKLSTFQKAILGYRYWVLTNSMS